MFCNIFATALVCHNCLQLECYWPLSTNVGLATRVRSQASENHSTFWRDVRSRVIIANAHQNAVEPNIGGQTSTTESAGQSRCTSKDCEWKAQAGNICVASFNWSCSGPVS